MDRDCDIAKWWDPRAPVSAESVPNEFCCVCRRLERDTSLVSHTWKQGGKRHLGASGSEGTLSVHDILLYRDVGAGSVSPIGSMSITRGGFSRPDLRDCSSDDKIAVAGCGQNICPQCEFRFVRACPGAIQRSQSRHRRAKVSPLGGFRFPDLRATSNPKRRCPRTASTRTPAFICL